MPEALDPGARDAGALRVAVVDDDAGLLRALCRQIRLLGHAAEGWSDPRAFLDGAEPDALDCLLVDLSMPGMTGLELQRALAARGAAAPVVFLSGHGDIPSTVAAMRGGALDFLEKPVELDRLAAAIARAAGKRAEARHDAAATDEARRRVEALSDRQRQVLQRMLAGEPNKVIAHRLGVVERTVKAHRQQVMEKTGARSVAELAFLAAKIGLTPESEEGDMEETKVRGGSADGGGPA